MPLLSRRTLFAVYFATGCAAGLISFALGQSKNLLVFRHASEGLLLGRDLYAGGFVDYFKYSPAFALVFLPFAMAPGWLAAALWSALNFVVAFLGIEATLPDEAARRSALVVALPGILLATDGDQANLLVSGTMLLAFASFERRRPSLGALAVAAGALVKLFPFVALLFALFHEERERSAFRVLVALGFGAVLPLVVLSPAELHAQYVSWLHLLGVDLANRGWSLVTVARDMGLPARLAPAAGGALLVGTLLLGCARGADARCRRAFAASVLAACVLFNHRSEYCSFVISSIGVAIWYADGPKTPLRRVLVAVAAVAHGPFFAVLDGHSAGLEDVLVAHRLYHPLRVVPLAAIFAFVQVDLVRALLRGGERRSLVDAGIAT